MVNRRITTALFLATALTVPALAAAQEKSGSKDTSPEKTRTASVDSISALPADWSLTPLILPAIGNDNEPVLIHFEREHNRFVGDVDMERFLRPGLPKQPSASQRLPAQPSLSAGTAADERVADSLDLKKNPVFNWSLSSLLQVSLDVIAKQGIQTGEGRASAAGSSALPAAVIGSAGSGKDNGGTAFSYTPPASSIGTRPGAPSAAGTVSPFSLEGYQLGVSSSLELGSEATLGFDFGVGQALSRDLANEESRRLTVTSLGIGVGHKRFRASVNSDVFLDGQGNRFNQQSTIGVQFDWRFDDSTLSVGARRPLLDQSNQAERDFSAAIPYIRYRKDL